MSKRSSHFYQRKDKIRIRRNVRPRFTPSANFTPSATHLQYYLLLQHCLDSLHILLAFFGNHAQAFKLCKVVKHRVSKLFFKLPVDFFRLLHLSLEEISGSEFSVGNMFGGINLQCLQRILLSLIKLA